VLRTNRKVRIYFVNCTIYIYILINHHVVTTQRPRILSMAYNNEVYRQILKHVNKACSLKIYLEGRHIVVQITTSSMLYTHKLW